MLMPWQQELDRRIAEVHEAGEKVLQGMSQPSAVSAAQARVNFITACQERFFASNGLLAFLTGDSPQRSQLIVDLDRFRREDATAQAELHIEELNLEGAEHDAEIARNALEKARRNVELAETLLEKCKLTEEIASWQEQLTTLGQRHAESLHRHSRKPRRALKKR